MLAQTLAAVAIGGFVLVKAAKFLAPHDVLARRFLYSLPWEILRVAAGVAFLALALFVLAQRP